MNKTVCLEEGFETEASAWPLEEIECQKKWILSLIEGVWTSTLIPVCSLVLRVWRKSSWLGKFWRLSLASFITNWEGRQSDLWALPTTYLQVLRPTVHEGVPFNYSLVELQKHLIWARLEIHRLCCGTRNLPRDQTLDNATQGLSEMANPSSVKNPASMSILTLPAHGLLKNVSHSMCCILLQMGNSFLVKTTNSISKRTWMNERSQQRSSRISGQRCHYVICLRQG